LQSGRSLSYARRRRANINTSKAIARMSSYLEQSDFAERDRLTGEDQTAPATGTSCPRCGHVIKANQTARLGGAGAGEWVHDMHPADDDSVPDDG
jgi:hypothetical protein